MSFNFVRQLDGMDCGPACLCMISRHYGKQYTLQEIRDLVNISKTGSSFLGLCDAAEKIGLRTSASMPTFEYFVKNVKLPCIVYWGQQHFVVVYKLKKKRSKYIFYVADPAYGLLKYDEDFFKHKWITIIKENKERGAIISFTSTPYFSKNDLVTKKKVIYNSHFLWNYIRPYRNMLFQLFLGILIGCIIQLLFPLLTKAMVDFGIGARKLNFVYLILLSQLFLVLGALSVDIVRRWIMLQITTRINISLVSDFLMKLMKLPMRFFDSKLKGDLIQRINDHNRIEFFLTKTLLNSLFSLLSILVFGFVLLLFDITLFLILLIGCFLYITWVLFFLKRRANIDYKNFSVMSVYQSNIIEMIEGMQEIKLTNSEKQKRWQWENIQTQIFEIKQKSLSLEQVQQIGSVFIMEITSVH